MRMSQLVDKCGLIHKGHMNLSFINRQFVKSNRTHSSNIAFCLSENLAIFNDMSSTNQQKDKFSRFHTICLLKNNVNMRLLLAEVGGGDSKTGIL